MFLEQRAIGRRRRVDTFAPQVDVFLQACGQQAVSCSQGRSFVQRGADLKQASIDLPGSSLLCEQADTIAEHAAATVFALGLLTKISTGLPDRSRGSASRSTLRG